MRGLRLDTADLQHCIEKWDCLVLNSLLMYKEGKKLNPTQPQQNTYKVTTAHQHAVIGNISLRIFRTASYEI
jgi:hypothetical protein